MIPTPFYLIDEASLLQNMRKIAFLREASGAKALLALKCFATWSAFDIMRPYMDGTTSSSLFELVKDLVHNDMMLADAKEKAMQMVGDAEERAKQLVSEQEIITRARMEVVEIRQSTQEEIEKLYHDVYQHIDEVLVQLDRSISEKLTDIRMTRQQIDQSMSPR